MFLFISVWLRTQQDTFVSLSNQQRKTTRAGTQFQQKTKLELCRARAGWISMVNIIVSLVQPCTAFVSVELSCNTSCLLNLQHSGIRASLPQWGRLRAQAAATQRWRARALTSSQCSPHRRPAPSSSPAPPLRPCWRARSCEARGQRCQNVPRLLSGHPCEAFKTIHSK